MVVVDYEPLTAVVDFLAAAEAPDLVHAAHGSNLIGGMAGAPAVGGRGGVRRGRPRRHLDGRPAVAVGMPDGDARHRRRPQPRERRDHHLCRDAGSPRGPGLRVAVARNAGEPDPRHHARHRWRVRPEDHGHARRDVRHARRTEGARAGEVDRGPAREPDERRPVARHEHAVARMAFDESGTIEAAQIDFVEDCGAYPVPFPVAIAATVGSLFPGPYRVPRGTFTTQSIYTNTVGRSAYRGPWVFESLARELLLDHAARQMGLDPVELRRRNLLRKEDQPYANPNGMTFDYISPLETLELAVEMLDYDGFRREQADGEEARPLPRRRNVHVRRADDAGRRDERNRRRHDPHRTVGHGQRVRLGWVERQQPRDDGRAAHRRRPRRRHRGRLHHSGRHRHHAVRCRHRRQPQRLDAGRCRRRDRVGPA